MHYARNILKYILFLLNILTKHYIIEPILDEQIVHVYTDITLLFLTNTL